MQTVSTVGTDKAVMDTAAVLSGKAIRLPLSDRNGRGSGRTGLFSHMTPDEVRAMPKQSYQWISWLDLHAYRVRITKVQTWKCKPDIVVRGNYESVGGLLVVWKDRDLDQFLVRLDEE